MLNVSLYSIRIPSKTRIRTHVFTLAGLSFPLPLRPALLQTGIITIWQEGGSVSGDDGFQ